MRLLLTPLRLTSVSHHCLVSPFAIQPLAVNATSLPGLRSATVGPLQISSSCHPLLSPRVRDTSLSAASVHTSPAPHGLRDLVAPGGAIRRALARIGVLNVSRARLRLAGYRLYETAADTPDYEEFFRLCEMPDTFFSWWVQGRDANVWPTEICPSHGPDRAA